MDAAAAATDWIVENKLRAVLYTWAGGITGALVSPRRPRPVAARGPSPPPPDLSLTRRRPPSPLSQAYQWSKPGAFSVKLIHR